MTTTTLLEAPTNEGDMEILLMQALDALASVHPDDLPGDLADLAEQLDGASASTFGEDGILTRNSGLVVRLRNGAQFQLTIVQSDVADEEDDEDEDDEL